MSRRAVPGAEHRPGFPSPHIPMETSTPPPRLAPAMDCRSPVAVLVQAAFYGQSGLPQGEVASHGAKWPPMDEATLCQPGPWAGAANAEEG